MLQLKKPLSSAESEVLIQCLTDMESSCSNSAPSHNQNFIKVAACISAKQKLESQVYDCFYHEEVTNMVFALDALSRKCSAKLTENLPSDEAAAIGKMLRTAATTRAKLKQATVLHSF